ncbi:hypothetical protein CERSUDRAFT_95509 [Gelatoporia subvermispora B]|uniref:Uncharacterized protein n=1 Tax=Ceriporiopsis subvermispora (strain B) TaxID=914234 RepID=M2PIZ7_CERS8|nr:hypothetical protein CERSUDRAFT_95509 [Gelatoporia subvermispora B]
MSQLPINPPLSPQSQRTFEELFDMQRYEEEHPEPPVDTESHDCDIFPKTAWSPDHNYVIGFDHTQATYAPEPWLVPAGVPRLVSTHLSFAAGQGSTNGAGTSGLDLSLPRPTDRVTSDSDVSSPNSAGRTPSPVPYGMNPSTSTMAQAAHTASMPMVSGAFRSMQVGSTALHASPPFPASHEDFPISGLRSTATDSSPTPSPPHPPTPSVIPRESEIDTVWLQPSPPSVAHARRTPVYAQEALMETVMRMHYARDEEAEVQSMSPEPIAGPSTAPMPARRAAPPPPTPQATTSTGPAPQPRAGPSTRPKRGRPATTRPRRVPAPVPAPAPPIPATMPPTTPFERIEGECLGGKTHIHGDDCFVVCRWVTGKKICGHRMTSEDAALRHLQSHFILEGGACQWEGCHHRLAGTSWKKHLLNIHCGFFKEKCPYPQCGAVVRRGCVEKRHTKCLEKLKKLMAQVSGSEVSGEQDGHDDSGSEAEWAEEVRPSRKRRNVDDNAGGAVKRRKIDITDIVD